MAVDGRTSPREGTAAQLKYVLPAPGARGVPVVNVSGQAQTLQARTGAPVLCISFVFPHFFFSMGTQCARAEKVHRQQQEIRTSGYHVPAEPNGKRVTKNIKKKAPEARKEKDRDCRRPGPPGLLETSPIGFRIPTSLGLPTPPVFELYKVNTTESVTPRTDWSLYSVNMLSELYGST